ncbi:MAG TPA: isochorismate synthase [Kofleriaceae bacterium]|nr:isochorismate synthase [Kofleriaceae bacterium]
MSARPNAAIIARTAEPAGLPGAAILERGLDEAARLPADAIARIAIPAAVAPAAALWRIAGDAVLWETRDEPTYPWAAAPADGHPSAGGLEVAVAGVGVAAAVSAAGAARFEDIAASGADVLARVVTIGDGPAPRLLGGFAFAPRGSAPTGSWNAFGDAWFALPRWTYERRGTAAWLVLAVAPPELRDARDRARVHAEHAAAVAALAEPLAVPRARAEATTDLPRERWTAAIEDIREKIAAGHCRKVVAARVRKVELASPVDVAAVLAELGRRHPECTRFGVRRGSAAFVGASPERLIRRRGDEVDSEALAGSIARPARAAATDDQALAIALLDSAKDRGEHDLVVKAIEQGLGPWCRELSMPDTPAVRTLRHVIHLHTPVHGELFAPRHVLALAAALHPTPAVGGTPTAAALSWIATHEPAARGWYAAPVGWFDAAGDGEMAVAIRSGLIDGATATLHAGAGIVRDSDAAAEWAETEVKLRALSGALGLEETSR